MKLSEAMRKGCEQHPRASGNMFVLDSKCLEIQQTCALGAAYIGAFGSPTVISPQLMVDYSEQFNELCKEFPQLFHKNEKCPAQNCSAVLSQIQNTIVHLNDHHDWNREKIVDWLISIDY